MLVDNGETAGPRSWYPVSMAESSTTGRQQEADDVRVELADDDNGPDPVSLVKNAQIKSLADAYRFQAEVLDELRGQLQAHKEANDLLKTRLEELGVSVSEWREFQRQERERVETQKPPIENTPITPTTGKPFGGPGF